MIFRIIDSVNDPALLDLTRIYTEAIPAAERKPPAWLSEAIGRQDFRVVAASAGEEVIAFATVFVPGDEPDMALLEYLAVDEHQRGRGVGAEVFGWIGAMMNARALLIEVDADREPSPLQRERSRRIAFYRRLGCRRIVGLEYLLPLDVTPPPPPVMDLMVANAPPLLRRERLARWLGVIYQRVYQKNAADLRINDMLAKVNDPVAMG